MRRPDFFIIGAPKCGTTAMNAYLAQHPEVFIPADKDRRCFGEDLNFSNRLSWAEFDARFEGAEESKAAGDASVFYLYSRTCPDEMQRYSPGARAVIMLRNPVEMVFSQHAQMVFNGLGEGEPILDFEDALAAERDRRAGRRVPPRAVLPEAVWYRWLGEYSEHVERWFKAWGRERVHVIIYDDFRADTGGAYSRLLQFIGVDPSFKADFPIINSNQVVRFQLVRTLMRMTPQRVKARVPGRMRFRAALREFNTVTKKRPPMREETRAELCDAFRPSVESLSELLDRDLTHWCRA